VYCGGADEGRVQTGRRYHRREIKEVDSDRSRPLDVGKNRCLVSATIKEGTSGHTGEKKPNSIFEASRGLKGSVDPKMRNFPLTGGLPVSDTRRFSIRRVTGGEPLRWFNISLKIKSEK